MSFRIFEITARIEDLPLEKAVQIMNENYDVFEKCAIIIHDKDMYTKEDEDRNPSHKAGELKPKHIHVVVKFYAGQERQFFKVAEMFEVPTQFVSRPRSRGSSIVSKLDLMLRYLINADNSNGYHYDSYEVIANFNYVAYMKALNFIISGYGGVEL